MGWTGSQEMDMIRIHTPFDNDDPSGFTALTDKFAESLSSFELLSNVVFRKESGDVFVKNSFKIKIF